MFQGIECTHPPAQHTRTFKAYAANNSQCRPTTAIVGQQQITIHCFKESSAHTLLHNTLVPSRPMQPPMRLSTAIVVQQQHRTEYFQYFEHSEHFRTKIQTPNKPGKTNKVRRKVCTNSCQTVFLVEQIVAPKDCAHLHEIFYCCKNHSCFNDCGVQRQKG